MSAFLHVAVVTAENVKSSILNDRFKPLFFGSVTLFWPPLSLKVALKSLSRTQTAFGALSGNAALSLRHLVHVWSPPPLLHLLPSFYDLCFAVGIPLES
jgi:hypothetical protein